MDQTNHFETRQLSDVCRKYLTRHFLVALISLITLEGAIGRGSRDVPIDSGDSEMNRIWELNLSKKYIIGVCDCEGQEVVVKKWSVATGEVEDLFQSRIQEICISHSGTLLGVRTLEDNVVVLGLYSIADKMWRWKSKGNYYNQIVFSADDQNLVGINDNDAEYLDAGSGKRIHGQSLVYGDLSNYASSKRRVRREELDPNARYLVVWNEEPTYEWPISWFFLFSPSPNPNIAVWDMNENRIISEIHKPISGIVSVAVSHDGSTVFLGCGDQKIRLWSLNENKIVAEISCDASFVEASRGNNLLAAGGHLVIWDYSALLLIRDFGRVVDSFGREGARSFNDDGKLLAYENKGVLYLYDIASGQVRWNVRTCATH